MKNLRQYGGMPFKAALIHGGPGVAGEMAPVAHELSYDIGVLEPLQTENTIERQLDELKLALEKYADLPVILIGFSWGAWLSFIFASKYPELVKKLILVSSGPFEQGYSEKIMDIRLGRMDENERLQIASLLDDLDKQDSQDRNTSFVKIGKLISKADTYDPIECLFGEIYFSYDIFQNVWQQAADLRRSGRLLEYAKNIQCPVTAIHGDYDPHPSEGVEKPLSKYITDFRFIHLKNCGHKPWIEKQAKDKFYEILKQEI
ncbi:MAG: alpha/beta hydrolase [Sedimentisphaerales bacterium]|nr:alpha/beta hydrolase [Sedimentisphaerales bacterium]